MRTFYLCSCFVDILNIQMFCEWVILGLDVSKSEFFVMKNFSYGTFCDVNMFHRRMFHDGVFCDEMFRKVNIL